MPALGLSNITAPWFIVVEIACHHLVVQRIARSGVVWGPDIVRVLSGKPPHYDTKGHDENQVGILVSPVVPLRWSFLHRLAELL